MLEIFVSNHCLMSSRAATLAAKVRRRFPGIAVRLIDVDAEPPRPGAGIAAVPTYVMNGRVVSLGNPTDHELFAVLKAAT